VFGEPSYMFNESDGTVTITVVKVGDTDQNVTVRVTGGKFEWLSVKDHVIMMTMIF